MKRTDTKRFTMKHPPDAIVRVGYLATRKGRPAVRLPDDVYERLDRKGKPEWIVKRRWRLFQTRKAAKAAVIAGVADRAAMAVISDWWKDTSEA